MKKFIIILVMVVGINSFIHAQVSEEIKTYVDYIKSCNNSPVDYIMSLFEKYDIVVLGERDHRDTTQYELIHQIISDQRFIDKIGHVMTEVGVYNMADELNKVLKGTYAHDTVFYKELANVEFNLQYLPIWEKTNLTQFHRNIYRVNKNLPYEKKISVFPTDIPFSWEQTNNMTSKEFRPFFKIWPQKDIIMAHNAINELYKIFGGSDSRKKALIIYNSPHSCRYYENKEFKDAGVSFYAYQVIADRFPGRVANIALNWAVDNKQNVGLTNNGKWDAAFAACGNKSIGFDLAGTPFGEGVFDIAGDFQPLKEILYKNVYHGFIFYKPISDWVSTTGVPYLDKLNCKDELARRFTIFGMDVSSEDAKNGLYKQLSEIKSTYIFRDDRLKIINDQIGQYYRPVGKKKQ